MNYWLWLFASKWFSEQFDWHREEVWWVYALARSCTQRVEVICVVTSRFPRTAELIAACSAGPTNTNRSRSILLQISVSVCKPWEMNAPDEAGRPTERTNTFSTQRRTTPNDVRLLSVFSQCIGFPPPPIVDGLSTFQSFPFEPRARSVSSVLPKYWKSAWFFARKMPLIWNNKEYKLVPDNSGWDQLEFVITRKLHVEYKPKEVILIKLAGE